MDGSRRCGTSAVWLVIVACASAACSEVDGSLLGPGVPGSGQGGATGQTTGEGGLGLILDGTGGGGGTTPAGNGFCGTSLVGTLRDFQSSHPDFEYAIAFDPGIVAPSLGGDDKPVYAGPPGGTPTTHGAASFDQWYRDVPGVNMAAPLTIDLSEGPGGVYTYDNGAFFPLDGQGFGDEGNPHNYHFTYELHTKFLYQGGEIFRFTGDDDLFTFIHGTLVIDLGGVHGAMSSEVDLDARAGELGITPGGTYALDVFFAERHTSESNFRIDTTLNFVDCGDAQVN